MADMKFVENKKYGTCGTEKKWLEMVDGHYCKGDTQYGDKFYIISKYIAKGEERTDKAFGISREDAEAVFNALKKYLGKE